VKVFARIVITFWAAVFGLIAGLALALYIATELS
jgi:hypothetical protein